MKFANDVETVPYQNQYAQAWITLHLLSILCSAADSDDNDNDDDDDDDVVVDDDDDDGDEIEGHA